MMKRILFLDDDIDDRELFQNALKALEMPVDYVEAKDGQEGLDLVTSENFTVPDIIFVDLNMPRVTGLEFVIRMKQLPKYENIPTYIYTTSASPRERVNCISAGATGYIIKHVKYQDLAKELKGLLSKINTPPDLTLF